MNRTVKAALAAFMLAVGLAGSVAAGPFEDGVAGYMKGDYATALRLLRSLAVQGDADAQFQLGVMYAKGKGVPQDYAAALRLMRPLAEQGAAAAQNNLGVMYHAGQGIPQDNAAAVGWYRKAAEQGNADALYNLGLMYGTGRGVPQDYVIAHMWINLAAASGNKDAAKLRDMATSRMTPAQIAEAQKLAREWKPK